jgi:transcriptional regulator with XRE-family HTH domain
MDEILKRILDCVGSKRGSQKLLADHLGIGPNVITNWKNGSNRSYRGYVSEIAEFYGVSKEYLLTGETKNSPSNNGEGKHHAPDAETLHLLELLETRSDIRYLAAASENATPEHVRATAKMFDELYGREKDK